VIPDDILVVARRGFGVPTPAPAVEDDDLEEDDDDFEEDEEDDDPEDVETGSAG